MFPFWLLLGVVTILMGIFNHQMLRILGLKPMSQVMVTLALKRSSMIVEKIVRWLMITIGLGFFVQGLGGVLQGEIKARVSVVLLGLSGVMILAIIVISLVDWKAR